MSSASDGCPPVGVDRGEHGGATADRPHRGDGFTGRLRRLVTATAFWVAIPLPFLYVPVLFSGLETRAEALAFGGLLVGHVLALAIGQSYAAERSAAE